MKSLSPKSARQRRWNHRNKEKIYSKRHDLPSWEKCKEVYSYMCIKCSRTEPDIQLTRDHIIPKSKGGSDSWLNIQPLCRQCNAMKGQNTWSPDWLDI